MFVRGVGVLIRHVAVVIVAREQVADGIIRPRMGIHAWNARAEQTIQVIIRKRRRLRVQIVGEGLDVADVIVEPALSEVEGCMPDSGCCCS